MFFYSRVWSYLPPHLITDYRDAPARDHTDKRYQQQQQQAQWTTHSGRVDHTGLAEARDNHAPSSRTQQPRRLTLADHPTFPAGAGTGGTSTGDVSLERQAARRVSSWLEQPRANSAASGTSSPHAGQREGASSIPTMDITSGSHHAGNQASSPKHVKGVEGQGRLRTSKSVLVLNGAACFVGGRLASTGESQVNIDKKLHMSGKPSRSKEC